MTFKSFDGKVDSCISPNNNYSKKNSRFQQNSLMDGLSDASEKNIKNIAESTLSETVASEPSDALSDESSTNWHVCMFTAGLKIIDIERFSSLDHLLRITTYVLKFLWSLGRFKEDDPLLLRAELLWIELTQSSLQDYGSFKEWRQQLGLFQDEEGYGGVGEGFSMLVYHMTVNILYCCQRMSTSQFLSSGKPTREYYIIG